MPENNDLEISVDDIMADVHAKLEEQKEKARKNPGQNHFSAGPGPDTHCCATNLHQDEYLDQNSDMQTKATYELNDFLNYHDRKFVQTAYKHLLNRWPDSQGLKYYVQNLRTGSLSKVDILGRLRYSAEGRKQGKQVRGLTLPFLVGCGYHVPVLGYILRLAVGILRLPYVLKNLQKLENNTLDSIQKLQDHTQIIHKEITELINKKADLAEVNMLKTFKADRDEVDTFLEQKINREEFAALQENMAHKSWVKNELETRADLKEVQSKFSDNCRDTQRLVSQIQDIKRNVLDQERRLRLLLQEARKRLPEPLTKEQLTNMVQEEEHMLDAFFISFEDRFRGTRADIKAAQARDYLHLIPETGAGTKDKPVLDLGCGRGEWLELLAESGYQASGVEANPILVEQCLKLDLQVAQADIFNYLPGCPDSSVGLITAFHLVEHLGLKNLIQLLDECLRVLCPGGYIIFETPNPENIVTGACNFYIDPTHASPIPPHTLLALVEIRGFNDPQLRRLHPNTSQQAADNVVNTLLFGPQDYAVQAVKAPEIKS